MKPSIFIFLLPLFSLLFLQSCEDDTPIEEQVNEIEYRITCDTPGSQLWVDATGIQGNGIYVKDSYSKALTTKEFFAIVEAKCENPKTLIRVELYVNNKLRKIADGNSHVFISERLKGKGPYLY